MWIVHLIAAILLTAFMCYIDEGYYSFDWLFEPIVLLVFGFYVAVFWGFRFLLSVLFKKLLKDPWRTWLSTFTLSFLGLVFASYFVYDHFWS
jgi:hypothetical protein